VSLTYSVYQSTGRDFFLDDQSTSSEESSNEEMTQTSSKSVKLTNDALCALTMDILNSSRSITLNAAISPLRTRRAAVALLPASPSYNTVQHQSTQGSKRKLLNDDLSLTAFQAIQTNNKRLCTDATHHQV